MILGIKRSMLFLLTAVLLTGCSGIAAAQQPTPTPTGFYCIVGIFQNPDYHPDDPNNEEPPALLYIDPVGEQAPADVSSQDEGYAALTNPAGDLITEVQVTVLRDVTYHNNGHTFHITGTVDYQTPPTNKLTYDLTVTGDTIGTKTCSQTQ